MITGDGPSQARFVPQLGRLLKLWQGCYGNRPIPARPRLETAEIAPWAVHACWIEHTQADRFLIRGFGIGLIRRFGREATGHCVEDLAPDISAGLQEKLWRAMAAGVPVVGAAAVQLGDTAAVFEEVVLPMAGDGERVRLFLLASYELNPSPRP